MIIRSLTTTTTTLCNRIVHFCRSIKCRIVCDVKWRVISKAVQNRFVWWTNKKKKKTYSSFYIHSVLGETCRSETDRTIVIAFCHGGDIGDSNPRPLFVERHLRSLKMDSSKTLFLKTSAAKWRKSSDATGWAITFCKKLGERFGSCGW